MQKFLNTLFLVCSITVLFTNQTFAHEVYVLKPEVIEKSLQTPNLNVFAPLTNPTNIAWLLFFAALAVLSLSVSFRISFSNWGLHMTKQIEKLKSYGLLIVRLFLGASLLFSAHYMSLFGPELPLGHLPYPYLWQILLYICGVLVTLGLFTQITAIVLLVLFSFSVFTFGSYMFTYINYVGEILVLLLLGGESISLDGKLFPKTKPLFNKTLQSLSVPVLRLSFGLSLLYAALYAKFFHTILSLDVVNDYHLTHYFPFDPLFIVLGAGMIEVTIAVLFLLGINMRWNIFFFAFWATLSLVFFGESVWPHAILFGICIGLFLYGYDQFAFETPLVKLTKKLFK